MSLQEQRARFANCDDFKIIADPPAPCLPPGMTEQDSHEVFHKFRLYARLPRLDGDLEPGDVLEGPDADGWAHVGTVHIYTRRYGVGRLCPADLDDADRCYLDESDGTPQPAKRLGAAPPGSASFRISHFTLALAWRGRGLGRRLLGDVLHRVPETGFIAALNPIPTRPQESERTDEEGQVLVERFWGSVGFTPCEEHPDLWIARLDDVLAKVGSARLA